MTRAEFIMQVEATQGAFRRFLVALCCGDSTLADDIAQESYVKAYLTSADLRQRNKFKAWLFKIGYTTFISHRRGERLFAGYEEARELPATDSSDSIFRYQDLYAALDRLPPKERTSVLLYYMEGYSIKEVAEIEGVSETSVRQHLSRGRHHLRGLLDQ